MSAADQVRAITEPLLAERGLEVVDVEHGRGLVRVTVDRHGGVDIDALSDATRVVSRALDEHDPIAGRYTLEVSSPGVERSLRTPTHFGRAVGSKVTVKTVPECEGERRVTGVLAEAGDTGIVVRLDGGEQRRLGYDDIERARTVFEWGPAPKPGKARGKGPGRAGGKGPGGAGGKGPGEADGKSKKGAGAGGADADAATAPATRKKRAATP